MINISVILPEDTTPKDVRVPIGETVKQFADMLAEVFEFTPTTRVAMTSTASGETYTSYDRITPDTFVSGDTIIVRG